MIAQQTHDKVVITDGYRTLTVHHDDDSFTMQVEFTGKSRQILLDPRGDGIDIGFTRQDDIDPYVCFADLFYVDNDETTDDPLRRNDPLIVINDPGSEAVAFARCRPHATLVEFEVGVKEVGTIDGSAIYGSSDAADAIKHDEATLAAMRKEWHDDHA